MDGQQRWRLGHRPGLDGLRGIAIVLVLIEHSFVYGLGRSDEGTGAAGVALFFVLSGFLITALLLEERQATGRVSLARFYVRRARRLGPALVALLVTVGVLSALLRVQAFPLAPVLLYYANWVAATGHGLGLLLQTWSLSVEEQFYLVWPIALVGALRWRQGPFLVASAGLLLSLSRWVVLGDTQRAYFGSDTQAVGLLLGCLLAVGAHRGLPRVRLPLGATLLLIGSLFCLGPSNPVSQWASLWVPFLGVVLVWSACCGPTLTWAPLRYVGRRSYALYLWHMPLVELLAFRMGRGVAPTLIALPISFAVAELSWRYVERPFQRRRTPDVPRAARGPLLLATHAARAPRGQVSSRASRRRRTTTRPIKPITTR